MGRTKCALYSETILKSRESNLGLSPLTHSLALIILSTIVLEVLVKLFKSLQGVGRSPAVLVRIRLT